jgi:AcrR family transcriptional regulator
MTRVTKKPAERRNELVDTAERFFLEKGYERTAVSDIVAESNVAQGTFYYYFRSKTDILEAVVEKTIAALEDCLQTTLKRQDITVEKKLTEMINAIFRFHKDKEQLIDCAHKDGNAVLHHKLERKTSESLLPPLTEVIDTGIKEGLFNVPYSTETAEIILDIILHQLHKHDLMSDTMQRERVRITLEHVLTKILGNENTAFALGL